MSGSTGIGLAWRLAWRNVGRNPGRTAIVALAVGSGVAGALIAIAVLSGAMLAMVDTAVSTELGHLQIRRAVDESRPLAGMRLGRGEGLAREVLDPLPGVRAWAPRARSEGLVFSPRASAGVRILGIDPARESRLSAIADSIVAGEYLTGQPRRALIGEVLAERLHVGLDQKIVVSMQDADGQIAAHAVRVAGLFRTASADFDRTTVYMDLAEARELLALGGDVSEIVLLADDFEQIPRLQERIQPELPRGLEVRTWQELEPMLVSMIEFIELNASLIYTAIFIAMAFGIANVLLMAVTERIPEIGLMLSIGMNPGRLVGIVLLETLLVTLIGLVVGVAAAMTVVALLEGGIDITSFAENARAFGVGTLLVPVLRLGDLTTPVLGSVLTAVVASMLPALRAVRIRPIDAVRHV